MKHIYVLVLSSFLISCGSGSDSEPNILDSMTENDFSFSDGDSMQSIVNDFDVPISVSGLPIIWSTDSNQLSYNLGGFSVSPADEMKSVTITATVLDGERVISRDFNIQIESGVLYFSGRIDDGDSRHLGYWTSESSDFLSIEETSNFGVMRAGYVFNNELYLAYEADNNLSYWTVGEKTSLEEEVFSNSVEHLLVNSTGVFLSGRANESGVPSTSNSSAFWDGQTLFHLDDTDSFGNNTAVAAGLIEKDGDILVVGHRLNGGFANPGYWNTEDASCLSGTCGDSSWTSYPSAASASCPNRYTRGCIIEDVDVNASGEVVALGRCQRSDMSSQACGDSTSVYRNVIFRDGIIESINDNSFFADQIYFDGDDRYMLGHRNPERGYYKNNEWVTIAPESGYSKVILNDLKVIGGNVYIIGQQERFDHIENEFVYLSGYWKNGEWRALSAEADNYQRVNTVDVLKKR